MKALEFVLLLGLFIIFYSYFGYGILVWVLIKLRKIVRAGQTSPAEHELAALTLVVAAFNEQDFIRQKIENSLALDYPHDKFHIIFITDGSSDDTFHIANSYPRLQVLHQPERKGKIHAIHRAMAHVRTPIVVFSDANTLLNKESLVRLARHYRSENVGGVAGEKKVIPGPDGRVAGEGEGIYWKYESFLKRLDADFYSVVGAAGELFSIRTDLYEYVGDNILLDDFVISLRICLKGYRVAYEPGAYAMETPSSSLREEQKRKIRISAGAFQSMVLLRPLLNIFKYPRLSFQYISHRVLRWTLCPLLLPIVFLLNIILVADDSSTFYRSLLACQLLFYLAAVGGWLASLRNVKIKLFYVPYYFFFLNLSLYLGFARYLKGRQSVLWEKAAREKNVA